MQVGKHDTGTVVVLAVAEAEEVLVVEDLLLEADEEMTGEIAKCLMLLAATAERQPKYLSDPQTASRFIAAIVLRKWVGGTTDRQTTDQDLTTEPGLPRHKDRT